MQTQTRTQFEAVEEDSAPENFEILSVFKLVPDDISETPPVTAKLFMSPWFTNEGGAAEESGKTRDYVVVLEYPACMDNTVVRMGGCPTVHGSRMFRKFVESVAEDKGYTVEREDVTEYF